MKEFRENMLREFAQLKEAIQHEHEDTMAILDNFGQHLDSVFKLITPSNEDDVSGSD